MISDCIQPYYRYMCGWSVVRRWLHYRSYSILWPVWLSLWCKQQETNGVLLLYSEHYQHCQYTGITTSLIMSPLQESMTDRDTATLLVQKVGGRYPWCIQQLHKAQPMMHIPSGNTVRWACGQRRGYLRLTDCWDIHALWEKAPAHRKGRTWGATY